MFPWSLFPDLLDPSRVTRGWRPSHGGTSCRSRQPLTGLLSTGFPPIEQQWNESMAARTSLTPTYCSEHECSQISSFHMKVHAVTNQAVWFVQEGIRPQAGFSNQETYAVNNLPATCSVLIEVCLAAGLESNTMCTSLFWLRPAGTF